MYDGLFSDYKPPKELVLRPIQQDMVNQLRQAFTKSKKIVLMAGTGLGKTIIATQIIKSAKDKGKRCVFINDRITLVNQTSGVFDEYGIHHGIIQADHPQYFPDRQVQVASAQTLARRDVGSYDLIVIDECHTLYRSHEKILKQNPGAYVLGLSATPFSKGLGKHFDFHIEPYTVRQLIDQGLLCDFEIYGPEIYDLSKVKTVAGDYDKKGLANATDQKHLVADVVQTYKKLGNGKKTICFCTNVAHGRHLTREFSKNGIKAVEVNAYQIPEETRENMRLFCDGEVDVICSVEILIKGFDLTSVDCVIWATATKSAMKWIQGSGRGLRIHPGKTLCRIIDHGGNCERLGFPDEYEFLELDDGKHKDSKSKDKDSPEQLPKACPSCSFLKAPGVLKCPACGVIPKFIKDVETAEGELKKIQRKTNKTYTKAEKQSFLNQLNGYCRDKGCNIGTASHKYKEKFGVWPNKIEKGIYEPVGEEVKKFIQHSNIKYAKSKNTHPTNEVSDKNNPLKSKAVKQEPLHGRLIRLDTPCKCGNKSGSLYPKGPHMGVECPICQKWLKWINQDDARLKLI